MTVGLASGTITAGAGRRSVTLTTGAGDTGNVAVRLARSDAGAVSFGRVKLEPGTQATPWRARAEESWLAARYCHAARPGAGGVRLAVGQLIDTGDFCIGLPLPAPMRTSGPSVFQSGLNRQIFADAALTGLSSSAAHGTTLTLVFTSPSFTAGTLYAALLVTSGSGSHITAEAEL